MKYLTYKKIKDFNPIKKALHILGVSITIFNYAYAAVPISQVPLITAGGAADNLVLVPSVEWPTINGLANLGNYSNTKDYGSYFDSKKCYKYHYSTNEADRHFYPVSWANNHACDGDNKEWSGNYLNWAATQTIDSFRSALTGGYRIRDTPTETWLEKARHDDQGGTSVFPNRRLPAIGSDNALIKKLSPFSKVRNSSGSIIDTLQMETIITGKGNKMHIFFNNMGGSVLAYDPNNLIQLGNTYELSIRVKVCVQNLLEPNCKQYGDNYKPEGVIQEYANRLRYSTFGYLNDSAFSRDGAALRAKQKSVGPYLANLTNDEVKIDNPEKEWSAVTGIFYDNPSPQDALATNAAFGLTGGQKIVNSGVINYINKFGQMTTQYHKSLDPVSEMYYAALRYLRNKGNVDSYTNMDGLSETAKYNYADGFPVLTNWEDPYQASCQASAFLGIGDLYTHRDKNLPGNTYYTSGEPTTPPEVLSDDINVITLTNKIAALQGLGNIGSTNSYTGRSNSAYIAGMAWYANTSDLRPDLADKQTAATFWVDVLSYQKLQGMATNQYALAAKYGGFHVPDDFDPLTQTAPLPEAWWHTNNDILKPVDFNNPFEPAFSRPDNYFIAGESDKIAQSIKQVFARIVARVNGSGSGLASNSTKMVTGSKVFQSVFYNKSWHGELKAYTINPQTGHLDTAPDWSTKELLTPSTWASRNIYTNTRSGYKSFEWASLDSSQKTALVSDDLVQYLRGNPAKEQRNGGAFRDRFITSLGDIVHSQPVLVSRPHPSLYINKSFMGATQYSAFANQQSTRTPALYVGANDGMLHSFNANTGAELYAFVPNTVIMNGLKKLADPNYHHQYYVDGELTVADVYIDSSWKTVLVGSLGAGGKAIFALDVTDPNNVKFLWEKDAIQIPALGNNLSKPVITQTADGQWQVVLGNGANSTGDKAQLIMINLATGNSTILDTAEGNNNGLAGVTAWSTYANGISDQFYAGDLKGNVWKFTPSTSLTPVKLFTAQNSNNQTQPITSTLLAGIHPETGEFWLFFGTGRYLSQEDLVDTTAQGWYGLKITSNDLITKDKLIQRSMNFPATNGTTSVRLSDQGTEAELKHKLGWYFQLPTNYERMVVPNIFQGDALIGTVRIPDSSNICQPTGRGFVIAINPFTGGRLDRVFFDVNGDQKFDENDNATLNGQSHYVSGIGFDSSPNSPIFIGNVMQVVQDNGVVASILTQGPAATAGRTSWHEIINTP